MFENISIGVSSPQTINAIIEIPKDTYNKYEYDEKLGIIKLDRVLHTLMHYPVDYGFIPETRSDDGDHLDIMVITTSPVFSGCLMEVRPLGVLLMKDDKGIDEKILSVPLRNPIYDHYKNLSDVSPHFLKEVEHFFSEYKRLENCKDAIIKGWGNRSEAYRIIKDSQKIYQAELKDKMLK